ncbi:MAG: IS110 family transposase [Bacteroidales bacterium]|nr:IS110 family transposase [Bacteroidales bacterium]
MGRKSKIEKMPVVNTNAAGIDVGGKSHFVSIGQNKEGVREFGVYTIDLHQIAKWFLSKGIITVAMESTDSYWQQLFTILQEYGLNVILVNGRFAKNVKGKKTDVKDCQWIQKLHSLGLLEGSFLPDNDVEALRTYSRHRKTLIENGADYIKRMQTALRLMNIRLDNVIRDVTGKSGRAIIEAILEGERNGTKLAGLADRRVKKSKEEIAKALTGNWRDEYIFGLRQSYDIYKNIHEKVAETDKEIEKLLEKQIEHIDFEPETKVKKQRVRKNTPQVELEKFALKMTGGIDLTQIPACGRNLLLTMMSEVGLDLSKFPTAKKFTSWLALAPNNKISGGKILSSKTPKQKNRLSEALLRSANVIGNMKDNPLSEFFHRVAYKNGRMHAITATARKLGVIIWNMLTKKEQYSYISNDDYKEQIRQHKVRKAQKLIKSAGISLEELKFVTV